MLATDPDCDRVGVAVKDKNGEYQLLSGNEVGLLLLDYICSQRVKHGKMPADPVMVKTIVTMDLGERIAAHYGVRTIDVLTGFKFIGEQIGYLEKAGNADSYIFGFEESYGYLTGSYVRDKDGVDGAYIICEMFSYYKTKGISLIDKLDEIYKEYGYCLNTLHCRQSDLIITVGRDLVETVNKRFHGNNVPKTVMINNWIDEKEIYPLPTDNPGVVAFKEKYGLSDKFVIMYSGNIGLYYDLENIMKVIEKFKPGTKCADGRDMPYISSSLYQLQISVRLLLNTQVFSNLSKFQIPTA